MDSLKKVISLNQAAQLSGYTQDYLGYLVRKGEIRGMKKGRAWFTTEEEVNNYLFKKKIRSKKLAIGDFFSPSRTRNIVIATIIVFMGGFLLLSTINKNKVVQVNEIKSGVTSDGEGLRVESAR